MRVGDEEGPHSLQKQWILLVPWHHTLLQWCSVWNLLKDEPLPNLLFLSINSLAWLHSLEDVYKLKRAGTISASFTGCTLCYMLFTWWPLDWTYAMLIYQQGDRWELRLWILKVICWDDMLICYLYFFFRKILLEKIASHLHSRNEAGKGQSAIVLAICTIHILCVMLLISFIPLHCYFLHWFCCT